MGVTTPKRTTTVGGNGRQESLIDFRSSLDIDDDKKKPKKLQERLILRFAKIDTKLRRMDSDHQFVAGNVSGLLTIDETFERIVFGRKILTPLLGARLVSPRHVYHVDLDEIEEIEAALDAVRPGQSSRSIRFLLHSTVMTNFTEKKQKKRIRTL